MKNPSCQDHFSIGISPESIKTFYPLVNNIENIKNIKNIESIENTAHKEVEGKSFDDVKFNIMRLDLILKLWIIAQYISAMLLQISSRVT